MLAFVIGLQIVVALFLILVILLQPGNKGGASAALGGAGSDSVFGGRGANTFLSKITFGAAVCFMVTNIILSFTSSPSGSKAVLDELENLSPKKEETTSGDANTSDNENEVDEAEKPESEMENTPSSEDKEE